MYKKFFRESSVSRQHIEAWVDSARDAFHTLFGGDPVVLLEEQISHSGFSKKAWLYLDSIGFTHYSFDHELQNVWICTDPKSGKYTSYFLQAYDRDTDERVHEVGIKFKYESDELMFRLHL